MAITRAQQAKQMLAQGGRIGLKGGADAATKSFAESLGGGGQKGKDYAASVGAKDDPSGGFNLGGGQGPTFNNAPATTVTDEQAKKAKKFQEEQKIKKATKKTFSPLNQFLLKKTTPFKKNQLRRLIDYIGGGRKFQVPSLFSVYDAITGKTKFDPSDYLGLENVSPLQLQAMFGTGPKSPVGTMDEEKIRKISKVLGQDVITQDEFEQFYPNMNLPKDTGGRDDTPMDPCKGPNPPAYCFVNQDPTTPEDPTNTANNFFGLTPRIAGSMFDFSQFAADGGRIGAMDGGIMNVEDLDREAFLLGGIAKGLKKAVKGVKKLVKSPIGKAALLGAVGFGLGGKGAIGSFFGKGSFNPFLRKVAGDTAFSGLGSILSKAGLVNKAGSLTALGMIGVPTVASLFMTPKEDENDELAKYLASQKLDPSLSIKGMGSDFDYDFYGAKTQPVADGGRIGYDEAGAVMSKEDMEKMAKSPLYKGFKTMYGVSPDMARDNKEYEGKFKQFEQLFKKGYQEGGDVEPVAKKTMPLLDMGGKEKDYRETGGFVDMGRMERADDVPARLSKNEFVFTADAVRNAGEGDIDKGAEVMYNMMKNLEAGGEVSEESQGLEGARKMFQTSQRLGEVI